MNKCKNCKEWLCLKSSNGLSGILATWGVCQKLKHSGMFDIVVDHNRLDERSMVETHPDFGCVEWEGK